MDPSTVDEIDCLCRLGVVFDLGFSGLLRVRSETV